MIVRNEAALLPAFLQAVSGVWDQLCVVDTGSTDATVDLVQTAGGEVASFTWNDDFSAARNRSLDMAREDWVLVLDPDETPDEAAVAGLTSLTSDSSWGAATVLMVNQMAEGPTRRSRLLRVFETIQTFDFVTRFMRMYTAMFPRTLSRRAGSWDTFQAPYDTRGI